jgi:dTDP-4-dehydrorhamnose 3,5-epimerase
MKAVRTPLDGVVRLQPHLFEDARGHFSETYKASEAAPHIGDVRFVQDNESQSREANTLRGLHYQAPPAAQAKLVRVLSGQIFDVVVDVRPGSPTFGQSYCTELDAEGGWQLFVPEGFLHGFLTLTPDCLVTYKVTREYDPALDGAVRWDCPVLGIAWPLGRGAVIVSDKDARAPGLADWANPFAPQSV